MKRYLLLLTLFTGPALAGPLSDHFARIELNLTDDRPTTAALVFDDASDTAWIDAVSASTRLHGAWYARPTEDIEVILTPKNPKQAYAIDQRLVTYLNLGPEDGDAVTIDLDASTAWIPLNVVTATRHRMNLVSPPDIDITPVQLVEIVRRQAPEHVPLARECPQIDSPPCQLVTDHELRIHLVNGEQRQLVGMVRLFDR